MKTEIVSGNKPLNEIDWSKPQLMISKNGNFVKTNGKHTIDEFEAHIIHSDKKDYEVLEFCKELYKHNFTPITEPITIKFIP